MWRLMHNKILPNKDLNFISLVVMHEKEELGKTLFSNINMLDTDDEASKSGARRWMWSRELCWFSKSLIPSPIRSSFRVFWQIPTARDESFAWQLWEHEAFLLACFSLGFFFFKKGSWVPRILGKGQDLVTWAQPYRLLASNTSVCFITFTTMSLNTLLVAEWNTRQMLWPDFRVLN